ncbi:MAG: tyrosine-type recombinase/integrase [Spirochaetia bacterium]|nr:tyrosine-type recombinase/integrase [Spirochaetia bacterium]
MNSLQTTNTERSVNRVFNYLNTSTRNAYQTAFNQFVEITGQGAETATAGDISMYLENLEARNYSAASINQRIAGISKVFGIYESMGLRTGNPVKQLKQVKRITRKTVYTGNTGLTMDQVKTVAYSKLKVAIVVKTLAATGLRISELIGIRLSDCRDPGDGFIHAKITGKGQKERTVYIAAALFQEIRETYAGAVYLFESAAGNQLSRQNLYKQIVGAFTKLTGRETHPHELRHFYATQQYQNGLDLKGLSQQLGHSSTAITANYYIHSAPEPCKAALAI